MQKPPGKTTRFFLLGAQIDRAIDKSAERADNLARARARRRRLGHAGPDVAAAPEAR